MAEHIDKTQLNRDLRYRFDYLTKFINFNQDDITMLNSLAPIIFPNLPTIVETVYKKLYSYDITKEYFLIRHDGFESFSPNQESGITLDSVQVDYRKDMLSVFLKHVLTQDDWNDSFLQYLSRVGEIHTTRGGSASIDVDYLHINALLCILESLFIDIIWNTDRLDWKNKRQALNSSNKFFWIQNHFFTMQYELSLKEKRVSTVQTVNLSRCFFH